ncbi:Arm DNA-binding domain-containing protein [Francisella sp. SYW-9]|uniref:Arm DNA-binding domain-containing protein n=1 Tax=Francisella sp. SYW-9 TaxID=2610888 RepID=UPI00123D7740|nr:Arm DNA-binding domain-containing protein [Francisella sp. SYW-9]
MGILTKQLIERSKEIKELEKDKAYRDGDGLYLLARPGGNHSWFYRFTYNGTRDKITLGKYKDISIAEARDKVSEYNKLLRIQR